VGEQYTHHLRSPCSARVFNYPTVLKKHRLHFSQSIGVPNVNLIEHAILLLEEGEPLPVDLTARLLEAGIDVAALENTYS
jgi:hypothetical protein